jgi:hypothetical protein
MGQRGFSRREKETKRERVRFVLVAVFFEGKKNLDQKRKKKKLHKLTLSAATSFSLCSALE